MARNDRTQAGLTVHSAQCTVYVYVCGYGGFTVYSIAGTLDTGSHDGVLLELFQVETLGASHCPNYRQAQYAPTTQSRSLAEHMDESE